MDKFGRNYFLRVGTFDKDFIEIRPPFTLQFDITRNTLTSANVCQVRIFNLSKVIRDKIRFNISDFGEYVPIRLYAGYGDNMPVIFTGNISQAWSVRERTNMVTQIECYDGGYAFSNGGKTYMEFNSGTTKKSVIEDLASALPHIKLGAVSNDFGEVLLRKNSYQANISNLAELTGGAVFVDHETANALFSNEYIDTGSTLVINSNSGLLGTPILEQTIVRFDMIFEPQLNVGTRIKLESSTEENFNGFYKVTAVKHRGIISNAVGGELTTTGEFFYSKILTPVRKSS